MNFWLKKPSHKKPFCGWKNKYKVLTTFTPELTLFTFLLILIYYLMVAEENGSSLQWFHFFDGLPKPYL